MYLRRYLYILREVKGDTGKGKKMFQTVTDDSQVSFLKVCTSINTQLDMCLIRCIYPEKSSLIVVRDLRYFRPSETASAPL